MASYRVLFVCMGNICRSPAAEIVVRALARKVGIAALLDVDSAGTHAYHEGEPPDPRVRKAAARRAYSLDGLRARRLEEGDFARFDRILAMDRQNLAFMRRLCPPEHHAKLGLFMQCAENPEQDEIPDPYYGGAEGFERVLDLCEQAAAGLLKSIVPVVPAEAGTQEDASQAAPGFRLAPE